MLHRYHSLPLSAPSTGRDEAQFRALFPPGSAYVRAPSLPRVLALILAAAILVRAVVYAALFSADHALAPLEAEALTGDGVLFVLCEFCIAV
jgi:hypothetical protein